MESHETSLRQRQSYVVDADGVGNADGQIDFSHQLDFSSFRGKKLKIILFCSFIFYGHCTSWFQGGRLNSTE